MRRCRSTPACPADSSLQDRSASRHFSWCGTPAEGRSIPLSDFSGTHITCNAPAAAAFLVGLSALSAPALAADPFTLIVVPDTQNYTDFHEHQQPVYNIGQMNWIVEQPGEHEHQVRHAPRRPPEPRQPIPHAGRQHLRARPEQPHRRRRTTRSTKWGRADAAIDVLDAAGVPYSLVPGNHDYLDHDTKTEPYLYLKTFGPQRYINNPKFDDKGNRPTAARRPPHRPSPGPASTRITRSTPAGTRWLNIALQDNPDDNDLAWAQKIINQNPSLPTIITTHEFVNTKGAANDYQHPDIFNKFVKNNPQIVMTFNGHLTGENRVAGDQHRRQDGPADAGRLPGHAVRHEFGANYYRAPASCARCRSTPTPTRSTSRDYSPSPTSTSQLNSPDRTAVINVLGLNGFNIDRVGRFGLTDRRHHQAPSAFRQGVNGYSGTRDTIIDARATPTPTTASDATAWVDGDRVQRRRPPRKAVVRFDSSSAARTSPPAHRSMTPSSHPHQQPRRQPEQQHDPPLPPAHRVEEGPISRGTRNGTASPPTAPGDPRRQRQRLVPSVQDGYITFDVTESLAAFAAGAPNNGWVLVASGNDGWRWDTSEADHRRRPPAAQVTYRVVPEPASLAFACGAGAFARCRHPAARRAAAAAPAGALTGHSQSTRACAGPTMLFLACQRDGCRGSADNCVDFSTWSRNGAAGTLSMSLTIIT